MSSAERMREAAQGGRGVRGKVGGVRPGAPQGAWMPGETKREREGRLRRLFPRLCGQRGTLRGESHRDMNPERGWGGWGASPSRVPVSDTEAQGRLRSTKLRRSPRPGPACSARSLPPAPSPSACAAAPSLSP